MAPTIASQTVPFGAALVAVQEGRCIARLGWNGKRMFVFQRPADDLPISFLPKVKSLPEKVKEYLLRGFAGETHRGTGEEITVHFGAYLCLLAADGSVVNGWLASQTDMLATDWIVLD